MQRHLLWPLRPDDWCFFGAWRLELGASFPRQCVGLFHELVAAPFAVALDDLARGGDFLRGFTLGLAFYEVGVSGEVVEALALEIGERLELVLGHEREELVAHRLHALVARLHDAGADLHGVGAEQDELRGVLAGLDPAEAGERAAGELLPDELGDFHHHAERDGLDGLRGITAGGGVALDGRLGAEGVEVDAADAADGVDGAEAIGPGAEGGAGGVLDVGDVGRHLRPEGYLGGGFHPAADFREDLRALAHGGAHLALGQEKLSSNASTPAAWQRSMISIHASLRYSSITEAMSTPDGWESLHFLNSSSQMLNGRSLMSSMFSQPMTSPFVDWSLA